MMNAQPLSVNRVGKILCQKRVPLTSYGRRAAAGLSLFVAVISCTQQNRGKSPEQIWKDASPSIVYVTARGVDGKVAQGGDIPKIPSTERYQSILDSFRIHKDFKQMMARSAETASSRCRNLFGVRTTGLIWPLD